MDGENGKLTKPLCRTMIGTVPVRTKDVRKSHAVKFKMFAGVDHHQASKQCHVRTVVTDVAK